MGNRIANLRICFTGGVDDCGGRRNRRHGIRMVLSDPYGEDLGHSFCYVRPDPTRMITSSKVHSDDITSTTATVFRVISGASVSANTTTPLTTSFFDSPTTTVSSSTFESSTSFASLPLQPIPRNSVLSASRPGGILPNSGPICERGFMSGPIERGFLSAPLDRAGALHSGPLEGKHSSGAAASLFMRSLSHSGWSGFRCKSGPASLTRTLRRAISNTLTVGHGSIVSSVKGLDPSVKYHQQDHWIVGGPHEKANDNNFSSFGGGVNFIRDGRSLEDEGAEFFESRNLQWAQGKAGEDRVHVVVSEEHGWVFVGIYDGFNGPDATDFLLSNLYPAVHEELKGLLWVDKMDSSSVSSTTTATSVSSSSSSSAEMEGPGTCIQCLEQQSHLYISDEENFNSNMNTRRERNRDYSRSKCRGLTRKREENQRRWRCEWDRERIELERRLKGQVNSKTAKHSNVLKALSRALRKTEETYLDIADKMLVENPELNLMGSCVLVMLMKGEDIYVMNVGDSRAVLAQKAEPDLRLGKLDQDLERISEETAYHPRVSNVVKPCLNAFQFTRDHSTSIEEEVQRIRNEHPDDACAVSNERVKGSLKVTRAFGAGFLKQPKWNNALLEMFRIDYIGSSPYINCVPSLCHHRLGPKDRFLVLSSDGLYQYFTNEEAVSEVELFISMSPEGDPAQHLVEELLFRAAKKAGMNFYELLEIPQGERRRYHDDVSIVVISFEGRIWRSCA